MNWFALALIFLVPIGVVILLDINEVKRKRKERLESMRIELRQIVFKYKLNKNEREELESLLERNEHWFYDRLGTIIKQKVYEDLSNPRRKKRRKK